MFEIYKSLDDVVQTMDRVEKAVQLVANPSENSPFFLSRLSLPDSASIRAVSSDGTMNVTLRSLSSEGTEQTSEHMKVLQRDFLPAALSEQIRILSGAIGRLASLMGAESWEFWELRKRPDLLQKVGIFDPSLVETLLHAWFLDGGFIEGLHKLGLHQDIDRHVLKLYDARFDPVDHWVGWQIEPEETVFDLSQPQDVDAFLEILDNSRVAVLNARDAVQTYIQANFSITDIM
jgi:hypothetical protein